jgi:hypothetical protein
VAPIQAAAKSQASWPGPVLALLSLSLAWHCLSFAGRESRKAHHQPKGRKNKEPTSTKLQRRTCPTGLPRRDCATSGGDRVACSQPGRTTCYVSDRERTRLQCQYSI